MPHQTFIRLTASLTIFAFIGCAPEGPTKSKSEIELQPAEGGRREGPLPPDFDDKPPAPHGWFRLQIGVVENPTRQRLRIRITVENTGSQKFAWDAMFFLGLKWDLYDLGGSETPLIDFHPLPRLMPPDDIRSRVISIAPGAKATHVIELTKEIRTYLPSTLRGDSGEWREQVSFSEQLNGVRIRLKYDPLWFGVYLVGSFSLYKDAGLFPNRDVESNELRVVFE